MTFDPRYIFAAWLAILVILFCPPRTPPSAPAACGLVNGAPVYAYEPVTYEERFSPEAIGPPAHQLGCQCMDCFPYTSAVNEACEGVGE